MFHTYFNAYNVYKLINLLDIFHWFIKLSQINRQSSQTYKMAGFDFIRGVGGLKLMIIPAFFVILLDPSPTLHEEK